MRVLLDTHIWIWGLLEPERLATAARQVLDDPGCDLHLSSISVWEALVLIRKGRLNPRAEPIDWIHRALQASAATMLPITHAVAIRSESIQGLAASDPADRFLAATALEHGMPLLTADATLVGFEPLPTVDAR